MAIPKTMKAIVVDSPGANYELREIPVPEPNNGEILIKVHVCGVCHSDASVAAGHMGRLAKFPLIPGHETVGTVVAISDSEKKWQIGDLVGGAWHGAHDGLCKNCNLGLFQMCDKSEVNGVNRVGGCKRSSNSIAQISASFC
jgi:D-arabinose 1-dehydrogenase-like Zn-dependent alcohol dehydrogenase